jgi:protein TonB
MSYQALLFCPDERLARVVTQVFTDLDFTVEPVNEPFAAVKKLMAQRYDAIVVDCENEPNATLLFKSARNSSSNQSSLAIALVEGQAGVAKAYRIGANLVLTKPINVEQAKGTLRVARGLLRKNVDSAPASPAPPKAAAPAQLAFKPAIQNVEIAPARSTIELPEFHSAMPEIAASAEVEKVVIATPTPAPIPTPAPVSEVRTNVASEVEPSTRSVLPSSLFEAVQPAPAAAFKHSHSSGSGGAASAPAPAREPVAPVEARPVVAPTVDRQETSAALPSAISGPSFAALDGEDSGSSGGSKKIMMIAAAVIMAAALGYFGWTSLGKSGSPSHASDQPMSVGGTPTTTASVTPSARISEPAVPAIQAPAAANTKPSASLSASPVVINPESDVVTKKIAPAIVVKSSMPAKSSHAEADESVASLPSPLAMAGSSNKNLSGIVSSTPAVLPTPSLTTLKISQGVSQGLVIKRVQPRYPANALSMRVQGAVLLEATINKEGNIANLKVLSGDAILARAAAEAVKQWRYKPYYLNGQPVEIDTQITVNFKLPN